MTLSLKYLEPEVYYDLVEKIALRKSEREKLCPEHCKGSHASIWTRPGSKPK